MKSAYGNKDERIESDGLLKRLSKLEEWYKQLNDVQFASFNSMSGLKMPLPPWNLHEASNKYENKMGGRAKHSGMKENQETDENKLAKPQAEKLNNNLEEKEKKNRI